MLSLKERRSQATSPDNMDNTPMCFIRAILTSTVYQAAQELCLPLVPGTEVGDDGADVQVGEVAVLDEAISGWWLPTYFAC